jgi:site-specific recombinase XerD
VSRALAAVPDPGPDEVNADSWRDFARDLRAEGKKPRTLEAYRDAFRSLAAFAGRDLLSLAKTDIQEWLISMEATHAQASRNAYYRGARRFYGWAEAEGLVNVSPMATMKPPHVDEVPVPLPDVAEVQAVIAACERDKSFEGFRDAAIIRIWCEAGSPRASEMAGALAERYDADTDALAITGKGGKTRTFPLSAKTARALARYLRARARHRAAAAPELFIGTRGAMTRWGMYQMLERRCAQAGVARMHPHQLRHFATDRFLAAGGRERDMMRLNGWSSAAMLSRYGAAAADRRASAAARQLALGDAL